MKLLRFNMQLNTGCLLTMSLDKIVEEFRREFGRLGENKTNELYRSFLFSTRDNADDKDNFISIMKHISKLYLGLDATAMLDRKKFIPKLIDAKLKPRSEAFMRNMYALYVFAYNSIDSTHYDLFQYMYKYTEIIKLPVSEWIYNLETNTINYGKDERVPRYILQDIIELGTTLLDAFCREFYITSTYTVILPNVVISGSTFIYDPVREILEIGNQILVPVEDGNCNVVNENTLHQLKDLSNILCSLSEDGKETNHET